MQLTELLDRDATAIVDEAAGALERSHLPHYLSQPAAERRARMQALFDEARTSLERRDLGPITEHAHTVAEQRFAAGVDVSEVQAAFNVLEEVTWRRIVNEAPAEELAEDLGLLSTVLGHGRDELARTYVSLATHHRVGSLDLTALFRGGR